MKLFIHVGLGTDHPNSRDSTEQRETLSKQVGAILKNCATSSEAASLERYFEGRLDRFVQVMLAELRPEELTEINERMPGSDASQG